VILRDYQEDAVRALWRYFEEMHGNPLVLAPTGTGKSLIIAAFVMMVIRAFRQTRVIAATHVETLISQNFAKLLRMWPTAPAGIFSAGLNRREMKQVTFAGIQSVYDKSLAFGYVDFLIIDEAHLLSPNDEAMYQTFIKGLLRANPKLKIIGLTATGWRLGMGSLLDGNIFTDIAIDMTTREAWNWFVDVGYLSPLSSKRTSFHLSAEGVPIKGDYVLSALQDVVDKESLTRQAIEEMLHWGATRERWLVFATGVEHCEHVSDLLNTYGIDSVAIHSKTKQAKDRLDAFKAGKVRAAVSMNKLTTGIDVPEIDLIGVLRHTTSSSLWVQMLGRGTRPVYADGYDLSTVQGRLAAISAGPKPMGALVLDFARNTERLGPVNDPVIPDPKKKGKRAGVAPVRVCPACAEYVHASKTVCPKCGYEFGTVLKIEGEASTRDVMARDAANEPVVELLDVDRVTWTYHKRAKSKKPPVLRVSHYEKNGIRKFDEWLCLEHPRGGAKTHAQNWWRERVAPTMRAEIGVPQTVAEAIELMPRLRIPRQMRVWTNTTYPRIVSYVY
jgi:DNA repair protein RadD